MKFGKSAACDGIYSKWVHESQWHANHKSLTVLIRLYYDVWFQLNLTSDAMEYLWFFDAMESACSSPASKRQKLVRPKAPATWRGATPFFFWNATKNLHRKQSDSLQLHGDPWGRYMYIYKIYNIVWLISVSWQTDLYPKLHRFWYLGLSKDLLRTAISSWIPRKHFSAITLRLICVLMSIWGSYEEVPPNVLGFGIANLLLAPLSCQKHGSPPERLRDKPGNHIHPDS